MIEQKCDKIAESIKALDEMRYWQSELKNEVESGTEGEGWGEGAARQAVHGKPE